MSPFDVGCARPQEFQYFILATKDDAQADTHDAPILALLDYLQILPTWLRAFDLVFCQQHLLNSFGMLTRRSSPIDDGLFFMSFRTCQAAYTAILRYQSQGVDDLFFGCATTIEDGPFGFDESTIARFTLVTLATCLSFPEFDDVRLLFTLQFAIIITFCIRAEIAWTSQF
jgi:hypothetical protein